MVRKAVAAAVFTLELAPSASAAAAEPRSRRVTAVWSDADGTLMTAVREP